MDDTNAPPLPPEIEVEAYKILAALFNAEESAFWTRNNVLVAVQALFITVASAVVGVLVKDVAGEACVHLVAIAVPVILTLGLCAVGFLTAVAWVLMVRRGELIANSIGAQLKDMEFKWYEQGLLCQPFLSFNSFGLQLGGERQRTNRPGASGPNHTPNPGIHADGYPNATLTNRFRISNIWTAMGYGLAGAWIAAAFLVVALGLGLLLSTPVSPACTEKKAATVEIQELDTVSKAANVAATAAASAESSCRAMSESIARVGACATLSQNCRHACLCNCVRHPQPPCKSPRKHSANLPPCRPSEAEHAQE